MTCIGALATKTVAEMVATIRAVGVDRVTLGTDFGQKINPHPAAGLADLRRRPVSPKASPRPRSAAWRARTRATCLGVENRCRTSTVPEGKADPEVRVWALRPEMGIGAGALSHAIYEQSIVPVRERELARMRIAQINGCAICQQWRKTPGAAEARSARTTTRTSLEWRDATAATPSGSGSRSSTPSCSRSTTTRIDDAFFDALARRVTPTPRSSTSRSASAAGSRSAARCTCSASTTPAASDVAERMEDRITPGLYLEMTDRPLDEYAATRVPEVLAPPGRRSGRRGGATCTATATDLPRVLPEFDHLGVYEVDATFAPPPTPAGITGHHFRHYRRARARASSPAGRRSACRSC